jgi:hypothetical protein
LKRRWERQQRRAGIDTGRSSQADAGLAEGLERLLWFR